MGTPLGPKYIPYTYMDPLGRRVFAGEVTQLLGIMWPTECLELSLQMPKNMLCFSSE